MLRYLHFSFFLLLCISASAQTITLNIRVTDSISSVGIPNVTYSIIANNNPFLTGKSDNTGLIIVTVDKKFKSEIKLTSLGYVSKNATLTLSDTTFKMSPASINLSEVSIKAESEIQFKSGKIILNVNDALRSGSNNVLELLRNMPMVSVNTGDGSIYLKGKPGVTILLDGRPITSELLQTLKPGSIKQIQLNSSASAKYSAEYRNGVINLISIKKDEDGYDLSADILAGSRERLYIAPTATIKTGKLNTMFDIAYDRRALSFDQLSTINYINSVSSDDQFSKNRQHYDAVDLISSYEFDERHAIHLSLSYFGYTFNKEGLENLGIESKIGTANYNSYYNNYSHSTKDGLNANLDYNYKFLNKKNGEITLSVLISNSYNTQKSNISLVDNNLVLQSENKPVDQEYTFQFDYEKPLFKNALIESGFKYITRKNDAIYSSVVGVGSGSNLMLDNQAGEFSYNQQIGALYSQWSYDVKDYSIRTGLRYEFYNYGYLKTSGVGNSAFFPNVTYTRKFKKNYFISLEYSNKIRRPGINYINTFIDQSALQSNKLGNENLRNEFVNDISIGANLPFKVIPVFFSIDYDFYKYGISDFSYVTQNTGGLESLNYTYINLADRKDLTLALNARLISSKVIKSNFNISVMRSYFEFANLKHTGYTFSVSESATWTIKDGFRINGSATYRNNSIILQGTTPGFTVTSISLNKHINKPDLNIGIGADNSFNLGQPIAYSIVGSDFERNDLTRSFRDTYYLKLSYSLSKNTVRSSHRNKISNNDVKQ